MKRAYGVQENSVDQGGGDTTGRGAKVRRSGVGPPPHQPSPYGSAPTPPLRGSRRDKGSARSRSGGRPRRRRVSAPRRRWAWLLLLAGSGTCCAAILLFPCLVLQGEAGAALSVRHVFSHLCHQDPQRCLSLAGVFLPVCNRCLALYLGGFLGVLLAPLARGRSAWLLGRPVLLLGPLVLTALDAGLDLAGAWNSTLWSRVATGGPAGLGVGALPDPVPGEPAPRRACTPPREYGTMSLRPP